MCDEYRRHYALLVAVHKKGGLNCVTEVRLLVSMQKYNKHKNTWKGGPTYALSTSGIKYGENDMWPWDGYILEFHLEAAYSLLQVKAEDRL